MRSYKPHDILFVHIDNQTSYMKHKKKLLEAKPFLSIKSTQSLMDNFSKKKELRQNFNKSIELDKLRKENEIFGNKLKLISIRENVSFL